MGYNDCTRCERIAMPIHNWAACNEGLFHWFHQRWIGTISDWLNGGRLPEGCYAIGELYAEGRIPDVLAVEDRPAENGKAARTTAPSANGHGVALAEAPPKTRFQWEGETQAYLDRKDLVAVRNVDGILLAVLEIVSPGNKSSKARFDKFIAKTVDLLSHGVHVLVIDLFPPTVRDPHGIHHAIWTDYNGEFEFHPDKPLTLASYMASSEDCVPRAFAEPVAVGDVLPEMPLFLWPERYVSLELEPTYAAAWAVYPAPLKPKVEGAVHKKSS